MASPPWHSIRDDLASSSVKQRLVGLESLLELAGKEGTSLSLEDFAEFVDQCSTLLTDSNFKVAQQTLHALSMLVCKSPDAIKPYSNSIVPLVAERLADARQQVRQDACEVLLKLLHALKPEAVIPRLARFWTHRSWKVRHGVLQTLAEAVASGIPMLLNYKDQNNYIITQVVNLVEDPNETVRDAALDCLQELFRALGPILVDNLRRQSIRPAALREVAARLDLVAPCGIEPGSNSSSPAPASAGGSSHHHHSGSSQRSSSSDLVDGLVKVNVFVPAAGSHKPGGGVPSSVRKPPGAGMDATASGEAAPVTLGSERELMAEVDAMAGTLASLLPDWQLRIAAMARLEAIARGCGPAMLEPLSDAVKALRDQLTKQIEDRRSAVNKQACQTLSVLSGVLGARFQEHAVHFLAVLFKVLPITVQIMAESADSCCQAILRSCQSHRLVPVLVQAATKDKNNKIRALCCGYVGQILETWDVSTILRCSDDLEAAIRAAAHDASGEARQAARRAFAAYSSRAPDQALAMLHRLEPAARDKLAKCGIKMAAAGAGGADERGASAGSSGSRAATAPAAASRPRITARKPMAAFAGAAAAEGKADVLVFVPERPAAHASAAGTATLGPASGQVPVAGAGPTSSAATAEAAVAAAPASAVQPPRGGSWTSRYSLAGPASTPAPPTSATAAEAALAYETISVHASTSAPASTGAAAAAPKPPAASGNAFPLPPAPPPRALVASASSAPAAQLPLAPFPDRQGSQSHRGPYRASTASDLPPMDPRLAPPTSHGGRKSLGFGPTRVPGPAAEPLAPSSLSAGGDSAGVASSGRQQQQPVHLKAGRRSTGGIGLMAPGPGTLYLPQAVRVPSSEATLSVGGTSEASETGGSSGMTGHAVGSPARRVTVPGHGLEVITAVPMCISAPLSSSVGRGGGSSTGGGGGSWGLSSGGSAGVLVAQWGAGPGAQQQALYGSMQQQQAAVAAAAAPPLSAKQSISKVVSGLVSAPKTWSEKVTALGSLAGLLDQVAADSGRGDQGSDCARDLERLAPKLVECIEDSHHKVATAALELLRVVLRSQPRALDAAMERVLPVVFQRTADPKDSLRALASSALLDCASSFPADLLLLGLARALEACKLPRPRCLVLEFSGQHLGAGRPAGVPANAALTKLWLRSVAGLLGDKNPDVRRAAVDSVEALARGCDGPLVAQYAAFATGPEGLALKRVLAAMAERAAGGGAGGGGGGGGAGPMEVDGVGLEPESLGPLTPSFGAMAAVPMATSAALPFSLPPAAATGAAGKGATTGPLYPSATGGAAAVAAPYQPTEYMTPMRVDVEKISDVGAPVARQASAGAVAAATTAAPGYWATRVAGPPPSAVEEASRLVSGLEPQAAARHVSLLVYRLQSVQASAVQGGTAVQASAAAIGPQEEEAAWRRLAECAAAPPAQQLPVAAWEGSLAQLRLAVARSVRSPHAAVRAAAARLVGELATRQPALVARALLDVAVPGLLLAAAAAATTTAHADGGSSKEASKVCYDALTLATECAPASASLGLLVPHLPQLGPDADHMQVDLGAHMKAQAQAQAGQKQAATVAVAPKPLDQMDPELLAVVVRCLHAVLRRVDLGPGASGCGEGGEGVALRACLLGTAVPGLTRALGHPRADIRKGCVFCLVELWCKLGDHDMRPLLEGMSDAQRKLLDIYYARAVGLQQQQQQ